MSTEPNNAANPAASTAAADGVADLTYLHPDNLRLGGTGVFAGDWAWSRPADGSPRIPVGFVGVLIDTFFRITEIIDISRFWTQGRPWWLILVLRGEGEFESCEVAGSLSVQWGAGPECLQAQEVEGGGQVHVLETDLGQAAVACAPRSVAGGLVHGAFDTGAAGVVGLEGGCRGRGAGGGLGFGQVAG